MKIKLYGEYGALNSKPVFESFAKGVIANGDTLVDSYDDADCVVIWSILFSGRMSQNAQVWERAHKDNKPVIVLEIGALKRGETWKVGINGINRDATWVKPYQEKRLETLGVEVKPWSKEGEFITIATQRSDSHQWPKGLTMKEWVEEQIQYCYALEFNRPIVIRPHPRDSITDWSFLNFYNKSRTNVYFDPPKLVEGSYDSFNHNEIFERSWLVINHSSGPGVQAILSGVNALVSKHSLAWDMGFDKNYQPDRTEWLNYLAHTEFTTNEIASGEPWKHLRSLI